eukprot:scaffold113367_cov45-Prasinocladus_malaysianus.AAC.1
MSHQAVEVGKFIMEPSSHNSLVKHSHHNYLLSPLSGRRACRSSDQRQKTDFTYTAAHVGLVPTDLVLVARAGNHDARRLVAPLVTDLLGSLNAGYAAVEPVIHED